MTVRKRILWLVVFLALLTPVGALVMQWRESNLGSQRFADAIAMLDVPLERSVRLESIDVVRAQAILDQVRRADPAGPNASRSRALWHVAQAYADLSRGEMSMALQEADTAERLSPGDPHVALVLATVAARRGEAQRAEHLLDALVRDAGNGVRHASPTILARASLLRIDLLLDGGRAHEALETAEALDREHPRVSAVKNLLGLAREAVGDREGAHDAFTRAMPLDARDETPIVNLARLEREQGDLPAARASLERALAVAPESTQAWMAYGIVLAEQRAPTARHALIRAAELNPDAAAPWVAQGNLDLAEGNLTGAVDSFTNALAREADHATAQTNLGIAYARQGNRTAAIEAFETATRRAPHMGEAWNGLGASRWADGNATAAIGPLQQASALLPDDPNPPLNLGLALESLQRWEDAARAFREAIRRSPHNDVAQRHLLALLPAAARERTERIMGPLASR